MIIQFMRCSSPTNSINKSIQILATETVKLKRDVDIISPTIIMRGTGYSDYNYCRISELQRYYFIRDVQLIGFNLYQIQLECDVLETYKSDILKSDALYNRGLKTGDLISNGLLANATAEAKIIKGGVDIDGQSSIIMTTAGE